MNGSINKFERNSWSLLFSDFFRLFELLRKIPPHGSFRSKVVSRKIQEVTGLAESTVLTYLSSEYGDVSRTTPFFMVSLAVSVTV